MEPLPVSRVHVEALHSHLCERTAKLHRPTVAVVMRVFLEVSSLASEQGLWSLEFAFEEDDARVARIEALFWDPRDAAPVDGELQGYEVRLTMPRLMPLTPVAERKRAADHVRVMAAGHGGLVARFVSALSDLGEYRAVEPVEALEVETRLL